MQAAALFKQRAPQNNDPGTVTVASKATLPALEHLFATRQYDGDELVVLVKQGWDVASLERVYYATFDTSGAQKALESVNKSCGASASRLATSAAGSDARAELNS